MSTQISVPQQLLLERILTLEIVRVTERAAVSAARLRGHGNEKAADQAAVDAMRRELNKLPIEGTVVIGEGERDEAPMLFIGEKVGTGGLAVDIALDPLEGTTLTAKAMANALAVMAMAEPGTLLNAPDTYMEVVRYSAGSDAMSFLGTLATDGGTRLGRPLRWAATCLRHPLDFLRTLSPFGWARRSTIVLVMQTLESSLRLVRERRWYWPFGKGLTSRRAPDQPPVPSYIPVANQASRHIAEATGGFASSAVNEVLLNVPTTAHILGGAPMAASPADGVIDSRNRVFGYDDFYVIDGSMIPSNLGVNPSLTITALAEHAMSHVPPKDAGAGLRPLPAELRAAGAAGAAGAPGG